MLAVYMDESGFTGEDLLSPEQRIFVHVSTTLSDEECAALNKEYFSGTQGPELKHKNLSKRPKGQRRYCYPKRPKDEVVKLLAITGQRRSDFAKRDHVLNVTSFNGGDDVRPPGFKRIQLLGSVLVSVVRLPKRAADSMTDHPLGNVRSNAESG